jgi:hypothetical protein
MRRPNTVPDPLLMNERRLDRLLDPWLIFAAYPI